MTLPAFTALAVILTAAPVSGPKLSKLEFAQRQFNQGEIDNALKSLDLAAAESPDAATTEKIQLFRAQCFAARQDFVKAEEAFSLALDANPETTLDPGKVDPTVVKLLEGVRNRLTGTLVLNSTPPGAQLMIDTKPAGALPLTLTPTVGKHKLEVRWGDGPITPLEVQVRPKREVRVEWVQGQLPVTQKPVVEARTISPYGDVRGTVEIATVQGAPVRGGIEVGGGVEFPYVRLGVGLRTNSSSSSTYLGLAPRFAFTVPVVERVSVLLEAWSPLWFRTQGLSVGLGAAAGGEFFVQKWVGLFLQFGAEYLFLSPGSFDNTHFVFSGGARLRLP